MLPPHNWELCPNVGTKIADIFVPGKTFLDSRYDKHLPVNAMYKPPSDPNVFTAIVDLTNTYRYYNQKNIHCSYHKIKCKGYKECPSSRSVNSFIRFCKSATSGTHIYVHCTFGFNRTGYMICCYLVERKQFHIHDAIAEFARARPPGIYKQTYIHKLCVRYNAQIVTISNILPDWLPDNDVCAPLQITLDKCSPDNTAVFKTCRVPLFYKQEINNRVAELVGYKHPLSFPGSMPVSMDNQNKHLILNKNYRVTWKANGLRYMLYIDGRDRVYAIDRDNNVLKLDQVNFMSNNHYLIDTLVDCECVQNTLYIFDTIAINSHLVANHTLDNRCTYSNDIAKCLIKPSWLTVVSKPFIPLGQLRSFVKKHKDASICDGFIFHDNNEPYVGGRQMHVIKWKDAHQNTIDFKLTQTDSTMANLIVSNGSVFGTIQCDKVAQYNGKIVECMYNCKTQQWSIVKHRQDKCYPNSWFTAMRIYESIVNPVHFDVLIDLVELAYSN